MVLLHVLSSADSKAMIISEGYTSILTLTSNFTTENHKLSCTASNSAGKGSASTMLTVLSGNPNINCTVDKLITVQKLDLVTRLFDMSLPYFYQRI